MVSALEMIISGSGISSLEHRQENHDIFGTGCSHSNNR